MPEAEVHTLQTGWCRYAGQDGAKRTNVWLLTQSPRAMDLVASGQAVAGPPTPEAARPRLALPGDGFGGELLRAMSSPHQARRRAPAGAAACTGPQPHRAAGIKDRTGLCSLCFASAVPPIMVQVRSTTVCSLAMLPDSAPRQA